MNKNKTTTKLTLTALMAALCYISFTYLQIKIPTPAGATSFHLGNVFCLIGALLIDGVSGGIAGAIGMGIGDLLDPLYVITVPKTIFLKFFIGLICGTLAHKVFKIHEKSGKELNKAILFSVIGGMVFNMIGEPVVSFIYYKLILGNATKAASYLTVAKWITTGTNSILSIIIATILFIQINKRFKIR